MFKRALPWILLLSGWIALASYIFSYFFCGIGVAAAAPATATAAVAAAPAAITGVWNYADGARYSNSHNEYFTFKESEYDFEKPLTGDFSKSLQKTSSYLVGHPDRQVNITGHYRDSEENTSILPNMGLARANSVKSHLQNLGVPAAQISTTGVPIADDWFKGGVLTKGVDFAFSEKSASNERIPDIKSRLLGKPLTLYFQTNSNTLTLSQQQRNDFADMFYYLDNVGGSSLAVSGHTDNVGSRDYNVNLSKERAKFVKDYLVSKGGINGDKLKVSGSGPDRPISDNNSSEGRAKNRRVEVTLE